jgi:hypothetical protein
LKRGNPNLRKGAIQQRQMRIEIHQYHHYGAEAVILDGLKDLRRLIQMSQEEFDQKIGQIHERFDGVTAAIAAEGQQIREFIAANPSVDTSALQGVLDRFEGLDTSVSDIFTPPAAPEPVIDEGNAGDAEPAPAEELPTDELPAAEPQPAETTGGGGDPQESTDAGGEGEGSENAGSESSDSSGPIEG